MSFADLTFDQVLEDLQARFIINIPREELSSIERICFQIEQAHWFYEDFIREMNPHLPSFTLKQFSNQIFRHCLILHKWVNDHETAFANFIDYKIRVPVCGGIILNDKLDKVLLVRGYKKGSTWGFPKGKINKDEPEGPCAVREVEEEIGFNMGPYLNESEYIEREIRGQRIRLYIIHGIPETTPFAPQTRKEIGDIKWHRLVNLPGWIKDESDLQPATSGAKKLPYYLVTSFVAKLKQWVLVQRKAAKGGKSKGNGKKNGNNSGYNSSSNNKPHGNVTDSDTDHGKTKKNNNAAKKAPKKNKKTNNGSNQNNNSEQAVDN